MVTKFIKSIAFVLALIFSSTFAMADATDKFKFNGALNLQFFQDSNLENSESAVIHEFAQASFLDIFSLQINKNTGRIRLKEQDGFAATCHKFTRTTLRCAYTYRQEFTEDDGTTSNCAIRITRFLGATKSGRATVQYQEEWKCSDGYKRFILSQGRLKVKRT